MQPTVQASANPARYLALQGGCNFRDIGGYAAADGRRVRWGCVYRAGVLSYFTSADATQLAALRVRAICDLRRAAERAREPTRWPAADAAVLSWDDGANPPAVMSRKSDWPADAAGMRAAMIRMYRELPRWIAPRVRGLFECLTTERAPLVVHCSAGKDRTGFVIAMLLAALGVDDDTILRDYLYTNEVGNFEEFARRQRAVQYGVTDDAHPLFRIPADIRQVLLTADADYLGAALQQLAAEYGGVDEYLRVAAGLGDAQRERLRSLLLDGAPVSY